MILSELRYPACLLSIKLLRLSKVLEVLMVHPNLHIFRGSHEVVPPFFKSKHDGEEFLVVDLIIPFCHGQCL